MCVQHFCSFGAMLFIVDLLVKTDSLLSEFLVCLSMFVMSHLLKKIEDLADILCSLVEFWVLSEIHVSETRFKQINKNLRLNVYGRMFWEPLYKISYPQLHKQLRKMGRFTYRF